MATSGGVRSGPMKPAEASSTGDGDRLFRNDHSAYGLLHTLPRQTNNIEVGLFIDRRRSVSISRRLGCRMLSYASRIAAAELLVLRYTRRASDVRSAISISAMLISASIQGYFAGGSGPKKIGAGARYVSCIHNMERPDKGCEAGKFRASIMLEKKPQNPTRILASVPKAPRDGSGFRTDHTPLIPAT